MNKRWKRKVDRRSYKGVSNEPPQLQVFCSRDLSTALKSPPPLPTKVLVWW